MCVYIYIYFDPSFCNLKKNWVTFLPLCQSPPRDTDIMLVHNVEKRTKNYKQICIEFTFSYEAVRDEQHIQILSITTYWEYIYLFIECGNDICELEDDETCSTCPADCGNCPLKSWHYVLIVLALLIVLAVPSVFGAVCSYHRYKACYCNSYLSIIIPYSNWRSVDLSNIYLARHDCVIGIHSLFLN